MPTYEYECKSCGHRFEVDQRMADLPLSQCPECRGPVARVIGNVGILVDRGRESRGRGTTCGQTATCCGRSEPCEKKPCE